MRKMVVQVSLIAAVGIAGFLLLFKRDATMGLLRSGVATARGFSPAQTPQEAIDKFKAAIVARDYDTAASYCGGDYAEQMRKGAKAANLIAVEIDNFNTIVDKKGFNVEKVKWVLSYLEPFPSNFKAPNIQKKSEDVYTVTIFPEDKTYLGETNPGAWKEIMDTRMIWVLSRGINPNIEIRQDGKGSEKAWKLYFVVTPDLRLSVDYLLDKYKDYQKALEALKYQVRNEPMTRDDMENRLRTELRTLGARK